MDATHAHKPTSVIFPRPVAKTGLISWLTTVDHKRIGFMYGYAALFFMLVGGVEALIIRSQLALPENDLISAHFYNQLFTMHGTTMIFLFVMPINSALFNYLLPLQIGARDVAFPRLNAFSLWVYVAGAIILNITWFLEVAPAVGWFGYAPLTSVEFSDYGTNFWVLSLQVLGVASIASSLNFIVTIINMRAPGMTMMRLPVFTWMVLITSFLIILAMPAIAIALAELMFDRLYGTNFFNPDAGGQPILWQHLFWIFGHPEVYILILPAFGIISEVLPTFCRKPLFGYPIVVFSGATIGFLGFAVWSHHMFTTGLGLSATAAFSLLTMAIAVPTGVKIFNWVGTIWGGRISFKVPMLFAVGFLFMFMMGGLTGIMHSAAPADAQQHDTYFVIAHFHYVLIGGSVMSLLAGYYFWVPKMYGRMMSEKWGWVNFILIAVGFNVAFFPQHFLGLGGMPRRTHTYLGDMGWDAMNQLSTIGAFVLGIGLFSFVVQYLYTIRKGKPCGSDPWDARTLEWALPSPVKEYNFARIPVVQARDCWWVHKKTDKKMSFEPADDHGIHMPDKSWFPLLASIGLLIGATALSFKSSGIPGMPDNAVLTYIAIAGGVFMIASIICWAVEGPGGYHVYPEADDVLEQEARRQEKSAKPSSKA
jgi:cytochrome c oxidase subunit 1